MEIPFYFCVLIVIFSILSQTITCKSTPGNTLGKTRILSEIRDIYRNKISTDQPFNTTNEEIGIRLSPMKGNLLEFHFSFTGTEGTSYDGGIYHGRILLHPDYPRKAPAISVLTPTGRWECGKDICLSGTFIQLSFLLMFRWAENLLVYSALLFYNDNLYLFVTYAIIFDSYYSYHLCK